MSEDKTSERVAFEKSDGATGESARNFEYRLTSGFWDTFVRPGKFVDVGFAGGNPSAQPIFKDAVGLDLYTPAYNGRDFPLENDSVGTVHASHLLEHVADYQYFFRECLRVLRPGGTLILMVPLMEAYEGKALAPSNFNRDHKRFYTASRLCYEIETSLTRVEYRLLHLKERFTMRDLQRDPSQHAQGPYYEIECVLEKTAANAVYP
jgi:predicted SAM-dependent methyltransferase